MLLSYNALNPVDIVSDSSENEPAIAIDNVAVFIFHLVRRAAGYANDLCPTVLGFVQRSTLNKKKSKY